MTQKQEAPAVMYRQYRELAADDRDTSDAMVHFSNNRIAQVQVQSQVDRIMQSLPAAVPSTDNDVRTNHSSWRDWLSPSFLYKPAMAMSMAMACAAGLFFTIGYQKPYGWDLHLPAGYTGTELADSIRASMGGSSRLGFVSSFNETGVHYHLGKTSVQLAVAMSTDSESLMPYFAATFKRLADITPGTDYSPQVVQITELLAGRPDDHAVGDAITELTHAVQGVGPSSAAGFALGREVELLRLALVDVTSGGSIETLQQAGRRVAAIDAQQWRAGEPAVLQKTLAEIQALTDGTYSLNERRQLVRYIEQLDILFY